MTKAARFSSADIARAKAAADKAGLCLKGYEVRPDGSIKLEFGDIEVANDWRADSPLYQGRA